MHKLGIQLQKTLTFGQVLEITAGIGVIAGIGLLAFELHQNNELLEAEVWYNHLQARSDVVGQLHQNSGLAAIFSEASEGKPLTSTEQMQLDSFYSDMFVAWEWEFQEGQIGSLVVPVWAYRQSWNEYPLLSEAWGQARPYYSSAFQEFMSQEVIGGLEVSDDR
ncbi:MAG: hypothetical protein ACI88G_002166 [Woeseiaceae bacterium]